MKPINKNETYIYNIIIAFSFIATCTTLAQHSTYHISGRVTDTEGEPLPVQRFPSKVKEPEPSHPSTAHIHYNSPEPVHTSSPPRI